MWLLNTSAAAAATVSMERAWSLLLSLSLSSLATAPFCEESGEDTKGEGDAVGSGGDERVGREDMTVRYIWRCAEVGSAQQSCSTRWTPNKGLGASTRTKGAERWFVDGACLPLSCLANVTGDWGLLVGRWSAAASQPAHQQCAQRLAAATSRRIFGGVESQGSAICGFRQGPVDDSSGPTGKPSRVRSSRPRVESCSL